MLIRSAKPAEADYLSELALRSKGYWGYDSDFLDSCKEELSYSQQDLQDNIFFLIEEQVIQGFYALTRLDQFTVELEALFVEPSAIGKGYGHQLMAHALTESKKLGAQKMKIVADPFAAEFYQRHGAQLIGSVESESIKGRQLPCFHIVLDSSK